MFRISMDSVCSPLEIRSDSITIMSYINTFSPLLQLILLPHTLYYMVKIKSVQVNITFSA